MISLLFIYLGGGFNMFFIFFYPDLGEMIQFDERIFSGGHWSSLEN